MNHVDARDPVSTGARLLDRSASQELAISEAHLHAGPSGRSAAGQSGTIAPAAIVRSAIAGALGEYDVVIDPVLLTGARIFDLLLVTSRWPPGNMTRLSDGC